MFNLFFLIICLGIASLFAFAFVLWADFSRYNLALRKKNILFGTKTSAIEKNSIFSKKNRKNVLRTQESKRLKDIVENFDLKRILADETTASNLVMAGYREPGHMTYFLFFRFVLPFVFIFLALFCILSFGFLKDYSFSTQIIACILFMYLGFYAPVFFIRNKINKRQKSLRIAYPDALDLILICVQAGMSVEATLKKVADEIGKNSTVLAEELALTNAELSFLPERRQAYENLSKRTGIEPIRATVIALVQADQYGTPVGDALRVVCDETREAKKMEIEKKASALPPKLTVPMIVFFLPVLFVVILGPLMIKIFY